MDKIEQLIGLLDRFKLSFYHFTDDRNLDSIRLHGILSMRELRARGIVPVTGGNQWSLDADLHSGWMHTLTFASCGSTQWSGQLVRTAELNDQDF